MKKDEVGREHSAKRGDEKCGIMIASLKETDHSEDLGVDGRIILKRILGKWCWSV
jgi:hypothetical protein